MLEKLPFRTIAKRGLATIALAASLQACGSDAGGATGSGTISGSFEGRSFETVGAAYAIGAPDDPERSLVIYVFDAPVACEDLGAPGWDEVVADQTQSLEIKTIGKDPGQYPVASGPTPSQGEANVNHTLTSTSGTPSEVSATGGQVTIDAVAGDGSVTGSFEFTFPSGDTLTGTFAAAPCADGHEP